MPIKKRILFRITSADKATKVKELIPLIKNIDDNAFEVSIVLNHKGEKLLQKIPADVDVIFLVNPGSGISHKAGFNLFRVVLGFLQLQGYHIFPSRIKNIIRRVPDIEVAFTPGSLRSLVKSPFKDSKKIFWLHADVRNNYTLEHLRMLARMMCRCSITVFDSMYAKEAFENHIGVKIPRSLCIHPYINEKNILEQSLQKSSLIEGHFSGAEKVFVSVGNLTYNKGYDILLAAHAELLNEGFDHKVLVIGSGSEYGPLQKMIRWLRAEDSFILLGEIDNPYPYIRLADYYIQPSRDQAYSSILGEVMALHKPIISTDVGGVGELLSHWRTAYLIQPDIVEIRESMKKFMVEQGLVNTIIQEQKKYDFQTYNKMVCDQVTDLFSNK